jgi:ribonuclease P protein component
MPVAPEAVRDSRSDKAASHFISLPDDGGLAAGKRKIPAAGFSAASRLSRKDGFDRVVQSENLSDRHFKVYFVCNNERNSRLGIIAGKKILPRAVDRNRIKRIIRETFRRHGIRAQGVDVVVKVRQADVQAPEVKTGSLGILFNLVVDKCAKSRSS